MNCDTSQKQQSAAWRSGSERRFYDDHGRKVNGATPNLVSLLRPWIRDVRSRFFETSTPILLQNYRILLQTCSGLRQKSKLQLLFSLLLLEEFLQTLQSQCYPNFRPVLNFMLVRLLVFRDCARTDASQRA